MRVDVSTDEEALDDLRRNADLYIFHQDDADNQKVIDVRSGRQLHSQQGTDVYIILRTLHTVYLATYYHMITHRATTSQPHVHINHAA